ncbi:MAG: AAA family ATPase [Caulobacteraceae bacterium]|nr:AAA family ATPase [Caulobacteraceae bacterium]
MRTIAVIALKGGSGKTTLAAHIALAAHLRGMPTLVADTDPQRSAADIFRARQGEGPQCIAVTGHDLFSAQMSAMASGIEAMVIDTAAGAIEDVGQAIVLADLSLLVVRPTLLDIAAAVRTVDVVRRLKKDAMLVVNQAPPARDGVEAPSVKRAMRALEFLRVPIMPTLIRSRLIYQTALETGRSAEEAFDVSAAEEIAELWAFIETHVFEHQDALPLRVADR